MGFLGKIFGKSGTGDDEVGELPLRNRTFSATQFRENELARAAEARARSQAAQIDTTQALSPALNPIAEALMADENAPTEEFDSAPVPESAEEADPVSNLDPAPDPEPAEEVEPLSEFETESAADWTEANQPVDELEPAPMPVPTEEIEPVEELEPAEAFEPAAVASPPQAADPMPWDEAVGWLSQRSAETRNFVGTYWNWDHDLRVLHFLAQQPDLDAGVAAHIFWITAACEDYFPFGDDEPDSEISKQIFWLTDFLGRRFAESAFRPASYGFDDSWDCVRLKKRLADLHASGSLPWSPEQIPTSSTAELMSFDDIPEDEREEVGQFLARFGVY